MPDDDTPSTRRTDISRRNLLAVTASTVALPVGHAAATGSGSGRKTTERTEHNCSELCTNARAVAEAYVAVLNASNRASVNNLIADSGDLSEWSKREFEWVSAFDFEFVSFQTIRIEDKDVIGDIELRIADEKRTVRYRFREFAAGNLELWAAISGLRTPVAKSARAAGNAYVTALNNADREKTNSLIAKQGQVKPWSAQDFRWVRAFSIELVDFEVTKRKENSVIADLTLQIDDSAGSVTYEFRHVNGGWQLWRSIRGIR